MRSQFPQDLSQHTKQNLSITGAQFQTSDQSTHFLFAGHSRSRGHVAAGVQRIEQHGRDPLGVSRRGEVSPVGSSRHFCVANQFIQADRDGLSQVHRKVLFASGDAHQKIAVTQVSVGQADFFRTEEQRDAARPQSFSDQPRSLLQPFDSLLRFPVAYSARSDNQRTVGNRFAQAGVFFRLRNDCRGSDSGARLAEGLVIRVDQPQMEEAEIAQRPGSGPDVEGIARVHQYHAQTIEFS